MTGASAQCQRGAVLVVGLIFLALLTLIGVTAFSVATQEERMAGNTRDRLRAFEAAEAALRECERIMSLPAPPVFSSTGGAGGFYTEPAPSAANQPPTPEIYETFVTTPSLWRTGSTNQLSGVSGVVEQPRCIVQRLVPVQNIRPSIRAELPLGTSFTYRITARGVGATANTAVVLQSTFIRD